MSNFLFPFLSCNTLLFFLYHICTIICNGSKISYYTFAGTVSYDFWTRIAVVAITRLSLQNHRAEKPPSKTD